MAHRRDHSSKTHGTAATRGGLDFSRPSGQGCTDQLGQLLDAERFTENDAHAESDSPRTSGYPFCGLLRRITRGRGGVSTQGAIRGDRIFRIRSSPGHFAYAAHDRIHTGSYVRAEPGTDADRPSAD